MASDIGHQQTDALLADLEKRITAEYQVAVNDVQAKLDDYLRRFQIKDDIWQRRVAAGEVSQAEYAQWRIGQMEVGKRWTAMRDELATEMHNANVIARGMVDGYLPDAYAINMNYATYQVERDGRVDTGFTLYNRDAVERIIRDQPDLLPPPSASLMTRVAAGKDILWNEGQIQSVMTQSILQGESIPNISKRIATTLGESNHASTIRYARTAVTGAQNAGREAAYQRAQDMGVNLRRIWRATLDNRTRHEHRYLDGQVAKVGEPFRVMSKGVEYEIRYPADPEAAGFLIWNCRCRTRADVEGWDRKSEQLRSYEAIGNMSYEEWLEAKPKSDSIFKQEEIAENMRRSYIRELYGGKGSGSGTESGSAQQPPAPFKSTMLEKTLGTDYDEFAHMVEGSGTRPLFDAYADACSSITKGKSGVYRPRNDSIVWSYETHQGRNKYSTLAHECGHMFDAHISTDSGRKQAFDGLGFTEADKLIAALGYSSPICRLPSMSDEFLKALRKDMGVLGADLDKFAADIRATARNSSVGVQDALDGFFATQDSGVLTWGHGSRYYNRGFRGVVDAGRYKELKDAYKELGMSVRNQDDCREITRHYDAASEAWANATAAVTCGGEELAAMEKWMPETIAAYKRIVGVLFA